MQENKVFIITGGARGIGLTIFKSCIDAGHTVVICSRNLNEIKNAIKSVNSKGDRSLGLKVDVSNIDEVETLISKTINQFGRIDVLVNNAGIFGPIGLLESNSICEWKEVININLIGTVNCCHAVLSHMKKNHCGKIINLAGAGIGGTKPLARFTGYYTSKMAIAGFTESLAQEVKNDNIQVNCISPGAINTKFTDILISAGADEAGREMYEQATRQKLSGGDDQDLAARMVLFLSSSDSDHITGKIISCKWDSVEYLTKEENLSKNLYNLRRVDGKTFYEKEEKTN